MCIRDSDEEIQLFAAAEDAEDDLGDKAGVAGIEAAGALLEEVCRKAAAFHGAQYFKCYSARGSHTL